MTGDNQNAATTVFDISAQFCAITNDNKLLKLLLVFVGWL
ncbi:Uncharacterised protein [Vibrio cholerae]|nr:Uncharacterised protein [Vibrio cholerae]